VIARMASVIALSIALVGSCATGTPPPGLPPPTDVDSLLTPRPPLPDIPAGLPDGADRSVSAAQCKGLPAGLWVSERKFAERIAAVAERDRLRSEVGAYKKLRVIERDSAEQLERDYRQALGMADRRAEVRFWIGLAVGAGTVLVTGWAVNKVGQ
jgi:hypothetical protein